MLCCIATSHIQVLHLSAIYYHGFMLTYNIIKPDEA